MFIGHFAAGLAAKKWAPKTSVGSLFLAAQWIDLVWPTFLLLGWEKVEIQPGASVVTPLNFESYPWTHSLLMVLAWAVLFAFLFGWRSRSMQTGLVMGVLVCSHWILDWVAHIPDLPLWPTGPKVGLSLWQHFWPTVVVEFALFSAAIFFFKRTMNRLSKPVGWGYYALFGFLGLIYLGNLWGPPPPNVQAIAWAGHLQWLFVVWAYALDRQKNG
ncbi:MAG: hypothetical protein H6510_04285 [Acidobacteria bacterium]|nr:hypothetical protein [Acidobacteriota bacterium]MCB9397015.1 hypothetical protein [Acidobacteriota bacterium]